MSALRWTLTLALLAALSWPGAALAHEFRSALLDLEETADGRFEVTWTPSHGADALVVRLPDACDARALADAPGPRGPVKRSRLDCQEAGLAGQTLRVDGLQRWPVDVLIELRWRDGRRQSARLTAESPTWVVPAPEPPGVLGDARATLTVLGAWLELGVEHILWGLDHLLFVLGLLLLVRGPRHLVQTITAFTLAHSLTLAIAALGWLRPSQRPVEVVIALSIAFLAREIATLPRASSARRAAPDAETTRLTLTQRAPWLAAFGFGLLHGFGFSGALAEIGLPADAIPAALLGFNLGVELGQLLFIAVALIGWRVTRPVLAGRPSWTWRARLTLAYVMGGLAVMWMLERALPIG